MANRFPSFAWLTGGIRFLLILFQQRVKNTVINFFCMRLKVCAELFGHLFFDTIRSRFMMLSTSSLRKG